METVATGLNNPYDVAVAANGDVYVAERGTDRILRIPAGSSTAEVFLPNTGLDSVNGVAVSPAGDVYVADSYHNRILRVPAGTSVPELFVGDLNFPTRLAFTTEGDAYISDGGGNRVLRVAAGAAPTVEVIATGFFAPFGLAAGSTGVYLADHSNKRVVLIQFANTPPTANAGPDQMVECTASAGTSVVLNGAGSFDAETV